MDTTIGQISNNCVTKATLQGCANNVPYLMVVSDGCCDSSTLTYINLEDGTISTTRPTDFKLGECPAVDCPPIYETESFVATAGQTQFTLSNTPYVDVDFTRNGATLIDSVATVAGNIVTYVPSANNNINLLAGDDITISYLYKDPDCTAATVNSSICFEFTENNTIVPIRVVSVNGSVVYYENDVLVTDSIRLAAIEAMVSAASASNVVCCPCASTPDIPPYRTCYKIGEDTATTKTTFGAYLNKAPGAARYIKSLKIVQNSPYLVKQTFDFSANPIMFWDGSNYVSNQSLFDQLQAVGYWDAVKTQIGCPTLVPAVFVVDSGNNINLAGYEPSEACDTQILAHFVDVTVANSAGVTVDGYDSLSGTYSWKDSFNGTPFQVIYANGVASYYENGIKVTDATRLAQLQAVVDAADPNSFICCDDCESSSATLVDCNGDALTGNVAPIQFSNLDANDFEVDANCNVSLNIPPYRTCYSAFAAIPITTRTYGPIAAYNNTLAANREISKIEIVLNDGIGNTICQTITPSPAIKIWDATTKAVSAITIKAELEAAGYFDKVKACIPCVDSWGVRWVATSPTVSTLSVLAWDKDNACDTQINNYYARIWTTSNGVYVQDVDVFSNTNTFTITNDQTATNAYEISSYLTPFEVYYIDGVVTYFEGGVEVTDATRISQLQALVDGASENDIVCCDDCGTTPDGSETKVQAGTGTTVTGSGTTADPYIVSSTGGASVLENIYFSTTNPNTVGTTFTPNTPQDLNKLYVSDVDGSTWIWNGTAYVSKTDDLGWKAIGRYTTLSAPSHGAIGSGVKINWGTNPYSYGSLAIGDTATDTILLKAGYIYELDVHLQASFATSGDYLNYGLFSGTTAATQTTAIGTPGKIRPNTDTFANGSFEADAQAIVVANVDTYVSVKTTGGGASAINSYENATYFKAKVIGVI